MPKLYVLSGPDLGRTFEVADGVQLGRGAQCAVHLRDASVSREHARIVRDEEGWRVVDTGSRNGLSVAGKRVPSAVLRDGDEFLVGEVLLRFRGEPQPAEEEIVLEEDPIEAAPAPPPPPPAMPERIASDLARTVLAAPRPAAAVTRGRGILQYKKIPDRPGFLASDLAQQPLWIRLGAGLLAIAVFAAIFLFAFKGTALLKKQAAGGATGIENEAQR